MARDFSSAGRRVGPREQQDCGLKASRTLLSSVLGGQAEEIMWGDDYRTQQKVIASLPRV